MAYVVTQFVSYLHGTVKGGWGSLFRFEFTQHSPESVKTLQVVISLVPLLGSTVFFGPYLLDGLSGEPKISAKSI